jgi:hypothetical protein
MVGIGPVPGAEGAGRSSISIIILRAVVYSLLASS